MIKTNHNKKKCTALEETKFSCLLEIPVATPSFYNPEGPVKLFLLK